MVTDKEQIIELLRQNSSKLQSFGVKKVGIFGSYVTGDQNKQSDVDLLVEFEKGKKNFLNFMGTANFVENLLGKRVEIVTPEALSPYIAPYVEKEVEYV